MKPIDFNFKENFFFVPPTQIEDFFTTFTKYYRQFKQISEECSLLESGTSLEYQTDENDNQETSAQRKDRLCSSEISNDIQEVYKKNQQKEQRVIIKKLEGSKDTKVLENYKSSIEKDNDKNICDLEQKIFDQLLTKIIETEPSCNIKIEDLRYEARDLYIPFRLLDGHFSFYFELCLGGSSSCPSFNQGALGIKTAVGTIELEAAPGNLLTNRFFSRTYKIKDFGGASGDKFEKDLGNSPKMIIDALISQQGLRVNTTNKIFKLVSITSEEYKKPLKIQPILLKLDEQTIENFNFTAENNNSKNCAYKQELINVQIEVSREPYRCLTSTAKVMRRLNNQKTYEFDMNNEEFTKEVLGLLTNPNNLKIETTSSFKPSEGFIKIDLKEKITSYLVNNLHCNESYNQNEFITIQISQDASSLINEFLEHEIWVDSYYALEEGSKKQHSPAEREISKGCAIFAQYITTNNPTEMIGLDDGDEL